MNKGFPPRPSRRAGSGGRQYSRSPGASRSGRGTPGLRRPRAWIFRQRPSSSSWPWPWLPAAAGAAVGPEPPAPEEPAAPEPPVEGAPAAEPPGAAASDGAAAAPDGAPAPGGGPEEPPQGELPPAVWASGRRLTVRWFARPRPLGPVTALGAPAGGGAYVVLVGGAPTAVHVTRDFRRDLARRLQGVTRRPSDLTIWYARVDGTEDMPSQGWRQVARGVRRALGLPPVPVSGARA